MYKVVFLLGWLLVLTSALDVANFPNVNPSLVAIKQKLRQKAEHRQTVEEHQTRSLELEKLQLQRDLEAAESYRNKDKRWGFSGSVSGNIGGAIGGAVKAGVSAVTDFAKNAANDLLDKGKAMLGFGPPPPPPPPPAEEEEVDDDCVEDCHDENDAQEKARYERQRMMHDKMDQAEKLREARELEREQLEALREQELQEKLEAEQEAKKQEEGNNNNNNKNDDGDPDDDDDNGIYPTKPLRIRGKKRVCKGGNCWYAPTNIDTEGLDIETSADEKRILRDRIAGMTGPQREGFRDGFEQGVNELRYFKQGYNLGFKEAKEEELREQRAEANRKPVIPLDPTLQSVTSAVADAGKNLINGVMNGQVGGMLGKAAASIGGGIKVSGGFKLFLQEDEKITKKSKTHANDQPDIPDGQGLRVGNGAADAVTVADTSCVMCQFYVQHIDFLFHLNSNNPGNAQILLQKSSFTEEEQQTLALLAEKMDVKHKRKKLETKKELMERVKAKKAHKKINAHHSKVHTHNKKAHETTHTNAHASSHSHNQAHAHSHSHNQVHTHTHAHASTHNQAHTHMKTHAHSKGKSPIAISPSIGQLPSDKRTKLQQILANPPDLSPIPNQDQLPKWMQPSPVYQQLVPNVYQQFAQLCAQHVPLKLMDTCTALLPKFRSISEALRFGDRADQVCRSVVPSCPAGTYIDDAPHVNS